MSIHIAIIFLSAGIIINSISLIIAAKSRAIMWENIRVQKDEIRKLKKEIELLEQQERDAFLKEIRVKANVYNEIAALIRREKARKKGCYNQASSQK